MLGSKALGDSETTAEIPHILDWRLEIRRLQVVCPTYVDDVLLLYAMFASQYSKCPDRRRFMTMVEEQRRHRGET